VKSLSKSSAQGIVEFKNELNVICKLQHTNLVQLIGHCIHEQERILLLIGYMSPEYAMGVVFSTKSDVYSFEHDFNKKSDSFFVFLQKDL